MLNIKQNNNKLVKIMKSRSFVKEGVDISSLSLTCIAKATMGAGSIGDICGPSTQVFSM